MGNVETIRRVIEQGDHTCDEDIRDGAEECDVCRAFVALEELAAEFGCPPN